MKAERIEFEKLTNTRDLGGLKTSWGSTIKKRKLIRSGNLFAATPNDIEKLKELVEVNVDFRTEVEADEKPDPIIEGIDYRHLQIMGAQSTGITREEGFENMLVRLARNPNDALALMMEIYDGFVLDDKCIAGYKTFFEILLEPHEKAILYHCTAGKDRTGFASILIELVLGVPFEDVVDDYLYTKECAKEEIKFAKEDFYKRIGGDKKQVELAVDYMFSPQKEFIDSLVNSFNKRYKDKKEYLDKLGLDEAKIKKLREMYCE